MTIGQIIIALVPNHPSKDDVQAILYACYLLLSCVKRREPIFVCYSDVWNDMKGTDAYYLYQEQAGLSQLLLPKAPVTQRRYLVLFISLKSDIDDNVTIAVKTSERYAPMLNRFLCLSAETSW